MPREQGIHIAEVLVAVLSSPSRPSRCTADLPQVLCWWTQPVRSFAPHVLTQKSEAIRLCSWSALTNCPISFTELYDPNSPNGSVGIRYVGTISTNDPAVIPNSMSYHSNMCLATITLFWTNFNGTRKVIHSRTSQTLIARYGIQNYIWGTQ